MTELQKLQADHDTRGQAIAYLRRPMLTDEQKETLAQNPFFSAQTPKDVLVAQLAKDQEAGLQQMLKLSNEESAKELKAAKEAEQEAARQKFGGVNDEQLQAAWESAYREVEAATAKLREISIEKQRRAQKAAGKAKLDKFTAAEKDELLQLLRAELVENGAKVNTPG